MLGANSDHSDKGFAERLQLLRAFTRLTREEFCKKYSEILVYSTYRNWETGANPKLSRKAQEKIRAVFSAEGVIYSDQWLLEGAGIDPIKLNKVKDKPNFSVVPSDQKSIDDLSVLLAEYNNSIVLAISDDNMSPRFSSGDFIAGIMTDSCFDDFIGHDCIIETSLGEVIVRRIQSKNEDDNTYVLSTINPSKEVKNPILPDVKINRAAMVRWHILNIKTKVSL